MWKSELAPWDTHRDSEYIFSNPMLLAAKNPRDHVQCKTNKLLNSSTSLLLCSQAIWHVAEFCSNFFPSSSWLMGWLTACCVQQQQFVNKSRPEQTSCHDTTILCMYNVHYITIATSLAYFTNKVFAFLASPNVDANLLFIPWLDFTTWSSRCLHTIMAISKY